MMERTYFLKNIYRNDLTPTVRASQTARRKAIYEELHPEAKLGATGVCREKVRQLGETNSAPADRFTAETAKITGKSERAVQRDAERGEKVIDEDDIDACEPTGNLTLGPRTATQASER